VLLTQWGYKILVVDWDLDAPGLENFFKNQNNKLNFKYFKGEREITFDEIIKEIGLILAPGSL
jgi:MinD-like ATPase involved in chromosome partitioning or flagellar assembly